MKQRRILYYINPVSGSKNKSRLRQAIMEKTIEEGIPFEILFTNADGYYPGLHDKIKNEGVTDIVVCGGDGSVNQMVASLLNVDVNIGIVPIGSGNGLALTAKIPRKIERALQVIFKGSSEYVDGFFINQKFSCMLCGVGFDAQVAHDFAAQDKRGLRNYVIQSAKNFLKARPYSFDITLDSKTFSASAFFISVANSNQFGNNFKIAPMASLHDGLLDVVVVKKMGRSKLILAILRQIRAGQVRPGTEINFDSKEVIYFQTDKLIIHNHEMAPLHIDGDPADTDKKFNIEILPKAFRLIMP